MNIYKSIQTIWANDTELNVLLPSTRVYGGRAEQDNPTRPYAVMTLVTSLPSFRTSKADVDRDLYQIAVYADRHDEAMEIQRVMREVLRNASPESADGQTVLFEKADGTRVVTEGRVTQALDQFVAEVSKTRRA